MVDAVGRACRLVDSHKNIYFLASFLVSVRFVRILFSRIVPN